MGKHLDFYYKYKETGILPYDGLCNCACKNLISALILERFEPTGENIRWLITKDQPAIYWGSEEYSPDRARAFTTLRQTIVLFMAAINNEL